MELIENLMTLKEYDYKTNWNKYYEHLAEEEDREWEDDLSE